MQQQVALVTDGGEGVGKAVALALAARGIRVVVTGPDERALAETVGEIACGAGQARHVAGDVAIAAARAVEAFGGLDVVVAAAGDAKAVFEAAAPHVRERGRFVAVGRASIAGLSCDAVPSGGSPEEVAARVVDLVVRSKA